MNSSDKSRLVGKHEMNGKSLYERLSRSIYMETQAHLTIKQIAEWHGLTEEEVEALAMDYLHTHSRHTEAGSEERLR